MWKQYDSLVLVPSAQLATHLSNNDSPSMWLMSLFTTWTNISPVAAVKVQLYHPSPLCFLTQHRVSATPNKLQYKTRGCWPNESRASSTLTDKTETESAASHPAEHSHLGLSRDKGWLWKPEKASFYFFWGGLGTKKESGLFKMSRPRESKLEQRGGSRFFCGSVCVCVSQSDS